MSPARTPTSGSPGGGRAAVTALIVVGLAVGMLLVVRSRPTVEAFDPDAVTGGNYQLGELSLEIAPAKIVSVCGFLKYDGKYIRLSSVTAVDRSDEDLVARFGDDLGVERLDLTGVAVQHVLDLGQRGDATVEDFRLAEKADQLVAEVCLQ